MTVLQEDDLMLLRVKATLRLRKLLQREKHNYQNVLHGRCGVGLTAAEFDSIVQGLVEKKFCCLREGSQGGVIVVVNEEIAL
jgi:hypothetical protein